MIINIISIYFKKVIFTTLPILHINIILNNFPRDIGVSNFTVNHLKKLLKNPEVTIVPAVNQVLIRKERSINLVCLI